MIRTQRPFIKCNIVVDNATYLSAPLNNAKLLIAIYLKEAILNCIIRQELLKAVKNNPNSLLIENGDIVKIRLVAVVKGDKKLTVQLTHIIRTRSITQLNKIGIELLRRAYIKSKADLRNFLVSNKLKYKIRKDDSIYIYHTKSDEMEEIRFDDLVIYISME